MAQYEHFDNHRLRLRFQPSIVAATAVSCLLFLLAPVHAALSVKVSDNGKSIGCYDIYEITMKHGVTYGNPWQDVKITAVFTKGTSTFTVGGFYYDTGTWKARFAPTEEGLWTWKLTFSAGADSYETTGRFTCVASDNPGFMRTSPANPYRFVTEAGKKPFHPVGIGGPAMSGTDSLFMDGLWGGKRISLKRYCDTLASGGVNLYRFNSTKWGPGWTPKMDSQGRRVFDVEVGKIADSSFQQFHDHGIHIMMVVLPGNPDIKNPERDVDYFRYAINRWGAYVDIWDMMNEVGWPGRPTTPEWYAALCPFIRDHDPYSHPITISYPDTNSIGKDAKGRDYLDITSPHMYHGYIPGIDRALVSYPLGRRHGGSIGVCKTAYPNKPVIFGECGNTAKQVYEPRNYSAHLFVSFFNEGYCVFWQAGVKGTKQMCIYYGVIERGMSRTFANYLADFDPAAAMVSPAPATTPVPWGEIRVYALRGKSEYAAYFHYLPNGTKPVKANGSRVTVDVPADNMTAMWISTHGESNMSGKVGELIESVPVRSGPQTLAIPDFDSGIMLVIRKFDDTKPILQFRACGYYMPEDSGKAVIEVQRLGSSAGAVSVKYATGDDTALSGTDYKAVSGTLSWADGDASVKTISIPIVNRPDALDDYDRGFHVVLSNPAGGAVLGPAQTSIVGIIGISAKSSDVKP